MGKIKIQFIYFTCFIIALFFANSKSTVQESPILLFNGTGTSPNDVEAIKNILYSNRMDFVILNTAQLNGLDTNQLGKYKLIFIPGGNFIAIGKNIKTETTHNIRTVVHGGLNYLGICAGGFLALDTRHDSLNIAEGVQFKFYSADDKSKRKAVVAVTNADGTMI